MYYHVIQELFRGKNVTMTVADFFLHKVQEFMCIIMKLQDFFAWVDVTLMAQDLLLQCAVPVTVFYYHDIPRFFNRSKC
jgi:hypothetical protein